MARYFKRMYGHHLSVFEFILASERHPKVLARKPFSAITRILRSDRDVSNNKASIDYDFPLSLMLLGTLQPFVDMANDAVDTFRPSGWQKIENDRGIRRLLEEADRVEKYAIPENDQQQGSTQKIYTYLQSINNELKGKYQRAIAQKRKNLPEIPADNNPAKTQKVYHDDSEHPQNLIPLETQQTIECKNMEDFSHIRFFKNKAIESDNQRIAELQDQYVPVRSH